MVRSGAAPRRAPPTVRAAAPPGCCHGNRPAERRNPAGGGRRDPARSRRHAPRLRPRSAAEGQRPRHPRPPPPKSWLPPRSEGLRPHIAAAPSPAVPPGAAGCVTALRGCISPVRRAAVTSRSLPSPNRHHISHRGPPCPHTTAISRRAPSVLTATVPSPTRDPPVPSTAVTPPAGPYLGCHGPPTPQPTLHSYFASAKRACRTVGGSMRCDEADEGVKWAAVCVLCALPASSSFPGARPQDAAGQPAPKRPLQASLIRNPTDFCLLHRIPANASTSVTRFVRISWKQPRWIAEENQTSCVCSPQPCTQEQSAARSSHRPDAGLKPIS